MITRRLRITGDRRTGKTTTMAYHLAQWLRENPRDEALVVVPMRSSRDLFLRTMTDVINVPAHDIKRVTMVTPNSLDHLRGTFFGAAYLEEERYLGYDIVEKIDPYVTKERYGIIVISDSYYDETADEINEEIRDMHRNRLAEKIEANG